jgi:hypothetical protein
MRTLSLGAVTVSIAIFCAPIVAAVPQNPTIVELYTSQGCSSCPPAEALIEGLAGRPDVLPLAFHVDYWDDLGWRDRFSMSQATQRQQDLARALRLSTVGTPQLIIDGRESVWGADREGLNRALRKRQVEVPFDAKRDNQELIVQAPQRAGGEIYDVYVVAYLPRAVTRISRGENAGRTLTEVNIVRGIRRLGQTGDKPVQWRLSVDSFPKDASRAAVFLQRLENGAIVGARLLDLRDAAAAD